MQEINQLFQYIKNNYNNYKDILQNNTEIIVIFYEDFNMKIKFDGFYKIYFNDYFYYDIDVQDIIDTIDDFLANKNVFCLLKNKIRIMKFKDYKDKPQFSNVWTVERKLK